MEISARRMRGLAVNIPGTSVHISSRKAPSLAAKQHRITVCIRRYESLGEYDGRVLGFEFTNKARSASQLHVADK